VDLVMQYYSGPAGECQARFDGPFEIDKSQEDRGVTLCPRKDPSALPYSRNALFKLKSGSGLVMNTPVLIYDKEGRRYRGIGGSGSSGSAGSEREFRVEQISLEDIVLVTVGEKPLEFEMNGIRVDPAGAVEETEARLAQIAKALDLPSVTWNDLGQYNFATDREKTIRSLPFLQGGILVKAWQEFTNASDPLNPVNPKQYSPELVEIVHQTALKWSGVPAHCQFGIGMGLWGGWPEFYPMALDQRMGFDAIENHPKDVGGTDSPDSGNPPDDGEPKRVSGIDVLPERQEVHRHHRSLARAHPKRPSLALGARFHRTLVPECLHSGRGTQPSG
jgi:hypothetical protein